MSDLPNFTEALRQLIASPSVSSASEDWDQSNQGIIQLLASWFKRLGFTLDIQQIPHTRNKYNLLAKIGSGEGGLLLSGHTDTVPFDQELWLTNPFELVEENERLTGLGTCDMKGFFALILQVCQQINLTKLNKPLYILATADEETTMAGARYFIEKTQIKPEVAIIGEPTDLLPVAMHKGHIFLRINIQGKTGHSSQPSLGVNAIEIVHQVIGQLIELKQQLEQNYQDTDFDVPYPTLNLGAIKGGDNANRICGHCSLELDMRALPCGTNEELILLLTEALAPVVAKFPDRITVEELHSGSPSFAESKTCELVRLAEQITGHQCQAVNYATEAPFIQQLGCQTLVLGPGSIEQAHQPNEFLAVDQVDKGITILSQFIEYYCVEQAKN